MKNHIRTLFFLLAFGLLLLPFPLVAATNNDIKVWPLFYQASDPVSHEARTEIFWPLYVRHQTPDYTANQFLSFPQTFPSHYPNQYYLFWPFGGVRAGHGHDAWLFPILWSGANADGGKRHHAVFPLCYYGKNKAEYSLNIALLQHNSWTPTSRFSALFPILWSGASHSETTDSFDLGVLPLGWMSNDSYHCPENQSASRCGGLFLINWWSRFESATGKIDGSEEKTITASDGVFPVFYRSGDWRSSQLRTDEENALWIFPYWQTNKSVQSERPEAAFKTTDESRHIFFPLWWDNSLREDQTLTFYRLCFPFWWHSGKSVNEAPEESNRFLVPIGAHFYKKGYYETHNLLGPMFNRTENSADRYVRYDAFFPLFSLTRGEQLSGGRFFPFFGFETLRGKYDNLWYVFPLGWDTESQEDKPGSMDSESFWALHQLEERPYTDTVAGSDSGPRYTAAFYPFYWSKRGADLQDTGSFPIFRYITRRWNRDIETTTDLPFFLGEITNRTRPNTPVYTRHDYLFSILAWSRGEDYAFARFFPVFSYENTRRSLDVYSLVPPFSYQTWENSDTPGTRNHSELSIPFEFLPVYSKSTRNDGADHITRKSWFFPFYKHSLDLSPKGQKEELSILWPLWNGEWQNDETRIRGMGGFTNFYEKDANGFVEQHILYRLFTRKTRSWFSELELMPFYAQQYNENGGGYWKFLGGLIGMENRDDQSYLWLCYIPIPLGTPGKTHEDTTPEQQNRHADLALTYLQHRRHDRAAIEFALAGNARADDPEFQTAAGETYLNSDAFYIDDELRSTMPVSLKFLGGKYETENRRVLKERLRELAISYFESAIRLGADKPALFLKIAQAYVDLEKPETALEKLAESDRLSPRFGTAMARLITLDRMKSKKPAGKSGADKDPHTLQRETLLKEIKNRYPASPSVFLYEADTLVSEKTRNRFKPATDDPFSEKVVKLLALNTQGSALSAGPEEQDWLKGSSFFAAAYKDSSYPGTPPDIECALSAVSILCDQASCLMDHKKNQEAASLFPLMQALLPRSRHVCRGQGEGASDCFGRTATISQVMHIFYRYYVETRNDPLSYLETGKNLAAPLCPHLKRSIDQCLENVRFELQYIKEWRITSVAGRAFSPVHHANTFYDRYINLDAILHSPDNCTVAADCILVSAKERKAVFRFGFDHTFSAILNSKPIFEQKSRKIAVRDEFTVPVTLKKGENHLNLTITDDTLAFGFFVRLSDEEGNFISDIQVTTEPPKNMKAVVAETP